MIAAIVCVDENWGIGHNGDLLAHIPEDMKFFKEMTDGKMVVMGRKTYDSLSVRPLPNRFNVVITSDINDNNYIETRKDGTICMGIDAIKAILENGSILPWDIYVIGGGTIYKELLPYCEYAYITKVFNSYDNADTFFPNVDDIDDWTLLSTSVVKEYNGIKYQFCHYKRKERNE